MRRALVISALALTTALGGCVAAPYGYYGPSGAVVIQNPPPAVVVQGPTIYPPQYRYRPWTYNDYRVYQDQQRFQNWYRCKQYYGNNAYCGQ